MRWWHIGVKDLRVIARDRGALGILLGMPMVLILILGTALGNLNANISKIPVAIVNLDQGKVGAQVTDGFFTDPALTRLVLAQRSRDPVGARAAVERGDLAAVLVVPADFSKRLNTGRPSVLVVYTDPGRQITAAVFRSVAEALSTRVSAASVAARTSAFYVARARVPNVQFVYSAVGKAVRSASETGALDAVKLVETTATIGREVSTLAYYAGAMSAMFIMFGAMFGAFSLIRERDDWTLPRILTTPARRADIVGGKTLGVFMVGLAQFAVLFAFTNLIGVRWGDFLGVWLIAISCVVAASGMAVLIAALGKTVRSVSGVAQVMIQFMAAIGGSFIAVSQFPGWMQPLHYFSVNGWAIDGFLATMRGGSAVDILPNVAALLAIGCVFFALGVWRLRWE
jgi:ABC-2 type transport system permease protein